MTETMVNARVALRWLMAAFYVIAGIGHLATPDAFLPIVPDWVPMPRGVILLTGLCELAGAAALLTARWRASPASCWDSMRCVSGPPTSSTQ